METQPESGDTRGKLRASTEKDSVNCVVLNFSVDSARFNELSEKMRDVRSSFS
jgi:hypothetical protein